MITNISEAHLSGFENFEALISTKMDIYRSLSESNGKYFLNKDDKNIKIEKNSDIHTTSFSCKYLDSDYYADISKIDKGIISINNFLFNVPYKTEAFARNFLASYSIAASIGIRKYHIQEVLDNFTLPEGRGDIIEFDKSF